MLSRLLVALSLLFLATAVPAFAVGENSGRDCSNCGSGTSTNKSK